MSTNEVRSSKLPPFLGVSPPALQMPQAIWQKLLTFVQLCPTEINGFGYVDQVGKDFTLEDVIILEQSADMHGVEVSAATLGRHIYELIDAGKDPGRMRFQWHSHVHLEAYFSATDLRTIENYGRRGDWMISLVANNRGDYQLRLDVFQPQRLWVPLNLKLIMPPDSAIIEWCQEEIAAKVHAPSESRLQPIGETGAR